MVDIHNYKRQFERQIELIKESSMIQKNKDTALDFKDYLLSEGIGVAKIGRYLLDIRKFDVILKKPFVDADKGDIRKVIGKIEQSELAPESRKCFKVMVRKLYRFIRKIEDRGVYPDEVKWISINIPKNQRRMPEELLTEEETKLIIQKCKNARDKAMVALLSESGCRISEIGTLQIKHVTFDERGARVTVKGKTGMRKLLAIQVVPFLQKWVNEHPENNNPEAYLWHSQQTKLLTYNRIVAIIKQAAKDAGIKKRIYAHLFRHSRATQLASIMTEAQMKQYFGWGQDSKMCGVYIHMNGDSTDEAVMRANGIEIKKDKKVSVMQPKKCLRCHNINEATNMCCKICGLILDENYANEVLKKDVERMQADEIMNKLMQDKEILELIKNRLNCNPT